MAEKILVSIIIGSQSDWPVMQEAGTIFESMGVPYEARVLSAHRTPEALAEYVKTAVQGGVEVIIAGAGGAAHLPGVIAAQTTIPVLGVPIPSSALNGLDSLLAIVQMPSGIPVGTLGIGKPGGINAALLAVSILGNKYPQYRDSIKKHRENQAQAILENSFLKG